MRLTQESCHVLNLAIWKLGQPETEARANALAIRMLVKLQENRLTGISWDSEIQIFHLTKPKKGKL